MVNSPRWDGARQQNDNTVTGHGQDPAVEEVYKEVRHNLSYQNSKNMHDMLFQLVQTMWLEKAAQWTTLLSNWHRCLSNNRIPAISENDLTPPCNYQVRNPNQGNAKLRGSWKSSRSALEDRRNMHPRMKGPRRSVRGRSTRFSIQEPVNDGRHFLPRDSAQARVYS